MFELYSTSLQSVAIETLCFLMFFAVAIRYKQWKQADGKTRPAQPAQLHGMAPKAMRGGNARASSSARNRKPGVSLRGWPTGYFSGESTDTGAGSNTDASSLDFLGEPCPVWVSANGTQQLGYVQYPQAFMMAVDQNGFNSNAMRLSSHAQPFVPTTGPTTGFQGDAGQQQQWGTDCDSSWTHLNATQGECQSSKSQSDLANIIGKLSPEDAATVMASLNVASGMDTAKPMAVPVVLYPHPASMASPGNRWDPTGQRRTPNPLARGRTQQSARPNALPKEVNEGSTLKENLRELSSLDPKCVLLVRKISKLGLNSPQLLEIYLSQFGPVDRVFISHSIEKPQGRRANPRWRPAALGFIAMKNAADAEAARARGSEHTVLGSTITVGTYEDHFAAKLTDEADSAEKADEADEADDAE